MKKTISLSLFAFFAFNLSAQTSHKFDGIEITTKPQTVTDKENRKFGYEYEVLEIKNTTSVQKSILFHTDAYYAGVCATCANSEYTYSFVLKPNETIVGSLKDPANKGLYVFKKDHNGNLKDVLSDLKFSNVVVK
ncbi:MAG: hypothetical protein FGM14_10800 [Flavobacteriales bacterium]|nr:hypothetical protein [Flavobacteriales bacterium]